MLVKSLISDIILIDSLRYGFLFVTDCIRDGNAPAEDCFVVCTVRHVYGKPLIRVLSFILSRPPVTFATKSGGMTFHTDFMSYKDNNPREQHYNNEYVYSDDYEAKQPSLESKIKLNFTRFRLLIVSKIQIWDNSVENKIFASLFSI